MANSDFYVGYNQNDFFYSKATDFSTNPSQIGGISEGGNSLPFVLEDGKCMNFFNYSIGTPEYTAARTALIKDISDNLPLAIQSINLGVEDLSSALNTYGGKAQLTIQSISPTVNNSERMVDTKFEGKNASLKLTQMASGRPVGDLSLTFEMPNQQTYSTQYGPRNISNHTGNPRCLFAQKCTKNHDYYSGGCKTQTYINKDGTSYCKCVCSGKKVRNTNNTSHSHCEEIKLGANTTPSLSAVQQAANSMKTVSISMTPGFRTPSSSSSGNTDEIITPDTKKEEICGLIADYYIALCLNKQKAEKIKKQIGKTLGSNQMREDKHDGYQSQMLRLANVSVGIIGLGAIMIFLSREQK